MCDTATATVVVTGATFENDVVFTLAHRDPSGERYKDFTSNPTFPTTITLMAGRRTGTRQITFTAIDDSIAEPQEAVAGKATAHSVKQRSRPPLSSHT